MQWRQWESHKRPMYQKASFHGAVCRSPEKLERNKQEAGKLPVRGETQHPSVFLPQGSYPGMFVLGTSMILYFFPKMLAIQAIKQKSCTSISNPLC